MLTFVDSAAAANPLPPGILVVLFAGSTSPNLDPNRVTEIPTLIQGLANFVGAGYLAPGGVCPVAIGAGTYTVAFVGSQAPTNSFQFTSTGSTFQVTVPNYQSPTYSAAGYAAEGAYNLPKGWFVDTTGLLALPSNIDQVTYDVLLGLGESQGINDTALQQVLGAMRLPTSSGASIDSWAYDFFGGTFYRFSQYGETDAQWYARIIAIFAIQKATVAGMQAILNVFWPWILLQISQTQQTLAEDTTYGGEDTTGGEDFVFSGLTAGAVGAGLALGDDTYGGEDTGTTFEDAPGPGILPPVPLVFDQQSNPLLAGYVGIAPPQFGIYVQYQSFSDTLIRIINSPSSILSALVNAWKPIGTTPVYLANR